MLVDASMSGLLCQATPGCTGLLQPSDDGSGGGMYECLNCDARQSVDGHKAAVGQLQMAMENAVGAIANASVGEAGETSGAAAQQEATPHFSSRVCRVAKKSASELGQALKESDGWLDPRHTLRFQATTRLLGCSFIQRNKSSVARHVSNLKVRGAFETPSSESVNFYRNNSFINLSNQL